ncbi:MAG: filamentous hemagglutinin N-terminal domain-containing protein [Leptolyngbyaceae cyanobacterium bins.349]|nr:filamentous hemagglutinin N-terminal domain-containing protein [Leptolyngbyaceae cyanobacterium bins.349]
MQRRDRTSSITWLSLLASFAILGVASPVRSQVVPDATLGSGNNSTVNVNGIRTDVNGGLRRGASLFHSFERFGIPTNFQVYFANPTGIRNIFSRVTGRDISNIDGLLGVAGTANLFFMNPNGIIFGPNARLDVSGSFFATTANTIEFPDNQKFSATGDRAVPLVEVNIPIGLQFGANPPAMLTNRGVLAAGQDLTLAAGNLDLQGQVQAGRNLTLNATDTVKIRDTVTEPFLARSGGNMTIQGNQGIDILALNHPTIKPFVSRGNLSLVSDGIISGDAHYAAGGDFSIRNTSGGSNGLISLYDPIITSDGNVTFADYTGPSLQIVAVGNISANSITINGVDPALGPDRVLILRAGVLGTLDNQPFPQTPDPPGDTTFSKPPAPIPPGGITINGQISTPDEPLNVTLSATGPISLGQVGAFSILTRGGSITIDTPSTLTVDGSLSVRRDGPEKTGDILIGTNQAPSSITVSTLSTRNIPALPIARDPVNNILPDGGDITIRTTGAFRALGAFDASTPNGMQVSPNPADPNWVNPEPTNPSIISIASQAGSGRSGDIDIRAGGSITLAAGISSASNFGGKGGNITLIGNASPDDLGNPALVTTPSPTATVVDTTRGIITSRNDNIDAGAGGSAGDVSLTATTGDIRSGSVIASYSNSFNGGFAQISLTSITGSVSLNQSSLSTTNLGSRDAGDIFIDADQSIEILNSSRVESEGTFGRILIGDSVVPDRVVIQNSSLSTQVLDRHTDGSVRPRIRITADQIEVDNSSLTTQTSSTAVNAGDITLTAQTGEVAIINRSQLTSTSRPDFGNAASTDFADITIQGPAVRITGSSDIDASTAGVSRGGNVLLEATNGGTVTVDGSSIRSTVGSTATANGGEVRIRSGQLTLTNGSTLDASNQSQRAQITTGGDVIINATGAVELLGNSSIRTTVELGSRGNGGNITIAEAASLSLTDGSRLSAQTSGTRNPGQDNARAGNINVTVNGAINIAGTSSSGLPSGLFTSTDQAVSGLGGNITVQASGDLHIRDRAVLNARTQSTSDGGNITVAVNRLETQNGGQLTTTATNTGTAGTITVTAPNGVLISGVAPPPTVVSPFTGVNLQEITGFTPDGNADIAVIGDGTFPYFSFAIASAGSRGIFDIDNGFKDTPPFNASIDAELFLFNRDTGTLLASNDDFFPVDPGSISGLDSFVDFTFQEPGNYVIGVGRFNSFASTNNLIQGNSPLAGQTFLLRVSLENRATSLPPVLNQSQVSGIFAEAQGTGNAGNITVNSPQLTINDGATIAASTTTGTAGNILVNGGGAGQVILNNGSQISAETITGGGLNPANVTLQGLQTLTVNNSLISSSTNSGTAGNVTVNAAQQITLDGTFTSSDGRLLGGIAAAGREGGNAGAVSITTPTLNISDRAAVAVSSDNGTGTAGDITINSTTVNLSMGARISASTDRGGSTDPSNITLTGLNNLTASSNSSISASTNSGEAGNVQINATQGVNPFINLASNSSIEATARAGGNAGAVSIITPTLGMTDGASVAVSSLNGEGTAGDVTIAATTVNLSGNAEISATTDRGGATNPANINLQGLSTLQLDNAQISAVTQTGRAGNLSVSASSAIALTNNSVLSVAGNGATSGDSGNITLATPQLSVNNSQISASTVGGVGGNVSLQGLSTLQLDNGQVRASTETGRAGNLSVSASSAIALNNNSSLSVEATGQTGNSGNVTLTTPQLTVNNSQISASTVGGTGGNVNLQGLNSLQMNNGQVSASTETGQAGDLNVNVNGDINLTNNSRLAVEATGANGVAGDITINGRNITLQNSEVLASSRQGRSGNIRITGRRLDLRNGTIKAETGQSTGARSGSIDLDLSFRLTLEDESEISTLGLNGADGGDITILNVRFLFGKPPTGPNGSDIVGRADGGGQGGRVFLDRTTLVQGFLFRRAEDGNRTNDIDTNGQLQNFSTDADVGARGLSAPLIVFNDVSQIVSSACEAVGIKPTAGNAELRITGRGGVPISPTAPLPAQPTSSDWVTLELNPQVPVSITLPNGATAVLQPGEIYQLQATCVNGWKLRQRSLL